MRALMLAILLLASHLASSLHMATVRHAQCAEHGEYTHAPEIGIAVQAHGTAAHGPRWDGRPAGRASDAHDHCVWFVFGRQEPLWFGASGALVVRPLETAVPPCAVESAPICAIPRYLLAPKQSPPAARSA